MRSSLPPPPDQIDEDDYRKQLRKMQRSMSPGSLQQLQSMAPEPRVGTRPVAINHNHNKRFAQCHLQNWTIILNNVLPLPLCTSCVMTAF